MKKINNIIILPIIMALPAAALCTELIDPTRPPHEMLETGPNQPHATGSFTLYAIFSYSGRMSAIINQQVVSVGSEIGDFSVTAIHGNTVELINKDQKKLTLELTPTVKQSQ